MMRIMTRKRAQKAPSTPPTMAIALALLISESSHFDPEYV